VEFELRLGKRERYQGFPPKKKKEGRKESQKEWIFISNDDSDTGSRTPDCQRLVVQRFEESWQCSVLGETFFKNIQLDIKQTIHCKTNFLAFDRKNHLVYY
jgi:hypothetical protein